MSEVFFPTTPGEPKIQIYESAALLNWSAFRCFMDTEHGSNNPKP